VMMKMICDRVKHDGVAEAYLLGTVDEETRDAFEIHLLDCAECLDELETLQALQLELAATRTEIEASTTSGRAPHGRTWVLWLAAAAVLAVATALLVGPLTAPDHPRVASAELERLADLQPAPYTPVRLRGVEEDSAERFRDAMENYQDGDFEAAAVGLRQAAELDPQAPKAGFYLGVSLLLTGDTGGAIESLGRTVALGDTLYLEWAHFYLAKAHLLAGDVEAARTELENTRDLHGDLETEAERLLGGLPAPEAGVD